MSVGQITPNYSFYAIPAFYILIISPHFYGTFHITKATNGNFDNANPRGQNCATLLKKIVPHDTLALFERAKAAHQNGLENLPLFASAVIIANIAKVDTETLNAVCAMFLVLRAVYIPIYIGITSRKLAWSRTGVFAASVCCSFKATSFYYIAPDSTVAVRVDFDVGGSYNVIVTRMASRAPNGYENQIRGDTTAYSA